QSEGGLTQTKRLVHVQLGKSDIDAIKVGHEIAQDKKWDEPPHHLADDPLLYVFHGEASRFVIVVTKSPFKIWAAFCQTMTVYDDECKSHFSDVHLDTQWCTAVGDALWQK